MRISITMPLYNKQATVERAVRSIISQSFEDWELVVVDDGSTDGSLARLRCIADGRIRVISQANLGPGAARNRGVNSSSAEYLAFLDSDDEWEHDYLSSCIHALISAPQAAAVTCGYKAFPSGNSTVPYWLERGIRPGVFAATSATQPKLFLSQLAFMSPCTTIVRRAVFNQLGGFYDRDNCRYAEDAFLFIKILARYQVVNLLEPLARIHFEDSNLSNARLRSREIEPFLSEPASVLGACPANTVALIGQVLALRAFKTSCVLSSWGRWREAQALRARFIDAETEKLDLATLSFLLANPFGSTLARIARRSVLT